jgi:glycerophosphoryl diester phosphodiesterase
MDWRSRGAGLRIGGHRGAGALAPENTIAALETAAGFGVDYVELDVALSADGVLVLMHDEDVDRTTDGRGPLRAMTWAEIARLDAGVGFWGRFGRLGVPNLEEVLGWLDAHPGIGATFEAKAPGTGGPLARAIAASPSRDRSSICSFSERELGDARAVDPAVPRMLIVDRDLADAAATTEVLVGLGRAADVDAINVAPRWLTAGLAAAARAAGLGLSAGTVNDAAGIRRLLTLRADFVDSDRPDLTVPALRS